MTTAAESEPKPKAKRATKPKTTTPRARKSAEPPRMRVVWAIYNQHLRRVAVFNFDQNTEAEKKLKELNKDGSVYFMQKVKEQVDATPEATTEA